uniref:Uncharacterized protein n=1 Tax=Anguilla anguilla TaxID=7936 RepID=A0A0E9RGJ1_ANGAN
MCYTMYSVVRVGHSYEN